jgi:hypothetical protein
LPAEKQAEVAATPTVKLTHEIIGTFNEIRFEIGKP